MSCNVCIETFNRSTNYCITCQFCEFQACKKCQETYLTSSNENAHCMNCKHEWDYKTLNSLFTKKFINNEYKKHTEKVLFDRERALLPATQPVVEEQKRKEKIKKNINDIEYQIRQLQFQVCINKQALYKTTENTPKTFIRKCNTENCRGFLNSEWKCSMCDTMSCSDCHEVKNTLDHTCKPENIETAKLLEKDTKSCPKCATLIFKIEGCDQMFCTQCQTPFSWKTGRVENGVIHNPHYFEWLRRNKNTDRNLLEVRCGREIDNNFIRSIVSICSDPTSILCRNIVHISRIELPKYVTNVINDNQDLRVKYLTQEITEDKFKNILQKRNKEKGKRREIANILNMYITSSTEILYRYVDEYIKTKKNYTEYNYVCELEALIDYTNNCFKDVSELYKSTRYQIHNTANQFGKFCKF